MCGKLRPPVSLRVCHLSTKQQHTAPHLRPEECREPSMSSSADDSLACVASSWNLHSTQTEPGLLQYSTGKGA